MKIIELKSSNIKRLKAVELHIDKNDNLVLVTGRNGQGKTSLIDSIWYALGGKKAIPDKPIRHGEEKGEIELTLESEKGSYIITRTFTEKGAYLKVTNKDGAAYSNAQEFLDYIIGNLSFDPLSFSRLDNKKQIQEIIKIVGLDFTELEAQKKQLTEERLLSGRIIKAMPKYSEEEIKEAEKNANAKEISVADINTRYSAAIAQRNSYNNAVSALEQGKRNIEAYQAQIRDIEVKIKEIEKNNGILSKAEDTKENIDELQTQINTAEDINRTIRAATTILDKNKEYKEKEAEYDKLTEKIKEKDDEKSKQLAKAKMPIEGLGWDEENVLYGNIPFNQLSGAEQLKVSMAIAMASSPKLRVILIRDGSLLDNENLKIIQEMVKNKDFQVWIEKVDDTGKIGIYIEEGEVKNINK